MENENTMLQPSTLQEQMLEQKATYCSFDFASLPKEKRGTYFNAISNTPKRIKECVNMPLNVVDMYAEEVTMVDSKTGEVTSGVRIVLIDDQGIGYGGVSKGIYNAMKKIIAVCGPAPWEGLTLIPKIVTVGERNVTTLEMG